MDDRDRLFAYLHRGAGYAYYATVNDSGTWTCHWHRSGEMGPPPLGFPHVYYSVHPSNVRKDSHRRAEISDIGAINCLYADMDAKDFGSSKDAIMHHIGGISVPASVITDSGGGYQLLWLIDQTFIITTPDERQHAIDTEAAWVRYVGADDGAKDLARVLRVPGTLNCKPEYGPDFPRCTIVSADFDRVYSLSDLDDLIPDEARAGSGVLPSENMAGALAGAPGSAYAQSALSGEIERIAKSRSGSRNTNLNRSAFALGTLIAVGALPQSDVERELLNAAMLTGLTQRESERTIRSGLTAGMRKPRTVPPEVISRNGHANVNGNGNHNNGNNGNGAEEHAVSAPGPDDFLARFDPDDTGNAHAFMAVIGKEYIYTDTYGWLHYNGIYWQADGAEASITDNITQVLIRRRMAAAKLDDDKVISASKPNIGRVSGCRALLEAFLYDKIGNFDIDPDLLNCKNGVLHLPSGQLIAHDPSQRFTYCIDSDYDPDADQTVWSEFVFHAVGDSREVYDYLQLAAGYTVTGHTNEECLFYVHGPTRSGKGTFTEALLTLLGKPLSTETEFSTITQRRDGDSNNFDLAPLKPCRFIAASESSRHQTMNSARVKMITGGNSIYCCNKNRPFFNYRPQFKIWLTSNWPPNIDPDDDAAWYRIRAAVFPNAHEDGEDKEMKTIMKSQAVQRGLLAWLAVGARRWYSLGKRGLVTPKVIKDTTKSYRLQVDYVQRWLDDCCNIRPDLMSTNAIIYASYAAWCEANGVEPKKATGLAQALKAKGFNVGVALHNSGTGKTERYVQGVKVNH